MVYIYSIYSSHILLSDKNPEGKCDQNTRWSSAPDSVLVTFTRGFFVRQQYMTGND